MSFQHVCCGMECLLAVCLVRGDVGDRSPGPCRHGAGLREVTEHAKRGPALPECKKCKASSIGSAVMGRCLVQQRLEFS